MADVFATLLQSALYKRAAMIEQFLMQHGNHYPGAKMAVSPDLGSQLVVCSCGESGEFNLITSVEIRITGKECL